MVSNNTPLVAPSILAARIGELFSETESVLTAGADLIHIDVMDGTFVPPITFGANVVQALSARFPSAYLETHLMIVEPERHFQTFRDAGTKTLIIHQETCPHLHRSLGEIRSLGMKSGVAVNPGTPVESVFDVLEVCDLVLVMTVNPGWGGQPFLSGCVKKIEALNAEVKRSQLPIRIEVDGGINEATGRRCREAGASMFVAGSYVFGASDRARAIGSLRE